MRKFLLLIDELEYQQEPETPGLCALSNWRTESDNDLYSVRAYTPADFGGLSQTPDTVVVPQTPTEYNDYTIQANDIFIRGNASSLVELPSHIYYGPGTLVQMGADGYIDAYENGTVAVGVVVETPPQDPERIVLWVAVSGLVRVPDSIGANLIVVGGVVYWDTHHRSLSHIWSLNTVEIGVRVSQTHMLLRLG